MNVILGLPIFWAFGAGMFATVNPCGFALLPAYVAYFLGTEEGTFLAQNRAARLARAALLGSLVTAGFITVFSVVGFVVSLGGRALIEVVPWASGLIGMTLIALGVALLAGRAVYLPVALPHLNPHGRGGMSAFLFGVAYATASLSCTLPIFIMIVGGALALPGAGLALFLSYGLGMGVVLVALTVSAALFKGVVAHYLRAALPYVERASALLLVGAGAYLVYYQLYWYGGFFR